MDLAAKNSVDTAGNKVTSTKSRACPDCGGSMNEVDRLAENGALFIWYQCSAGGCMGSWLEKKPIGGAVY